MKNPALFNNIQQLEISSPQDTYAFSQRLAKENQWTNDFTQSCIDEYKKFIYLSQISDQPVSPPKAIDQVWHLHLIYTRSYWNDLCQTILKRPLHHEPTRGGQEETTKFAHLYQATLDLYKSEFGCSPLSNIWPNPENNNQKRRIPRLKNSGKLMLALTAPPLLLVACSEQSSHFDIWFYIKLSFGIYIAYRIYRWLSRPPENKKKRRNKYRGDGCNSGCSSGGSKRSDDDSGHDSSCSSGCSSGCGGGD